MVLLLHYFDNFINFDFGGVNFIMAGIYSFRQWSLTVLRVVLGIIFAYHGYLKLFVPGGFAGTIGFFKIIGIPFPEYSALLVSVAEFLGGLALIAGFLAKWASLVLILDMLVALYKVHLQNKGCPFRQK